MYDLCISRHREHDWKQNFLDINTLYYFYYKHTCIQQPICSLTSLGKKKKSYVQLLQYGHPLTRAAQTALPVVQGGIEPIEVGSQTEV